MSMVYVLVVLSLILVVLAVWAIHWAIKKNQFDDLDSPAYSILEDDTPADRYQRRQQQTQHQNNSKTNRNTTTKENK